MDGIWTILGLEPTQDVSAIKRAYAQKARACHPEEDPEGFLELREAYQAALDYAGGKTDFSQEVPEPPAGPDAEEEEDEGWSLTGRPQVIEEGPNPYTDHAAIQRFLELYTGKQRKNPQLWLDYFTSGNFLDVAWERRFTALLLEHVTRLETGYPVNREFLNWLCVAYQFMVDKQVYLNPDGSERTEFRFQVYRGAEFDGLESIFEISTKGPAPRQHKRNELAMVYSFQEYRRLCAMAEDGAWDEEEIAAFSQITGCYAAGYITDKCQQRGDMDYERHPAGLRLMTHFFRREGLPEELYRLAWQKLELKTAIMGRSKILYGGLRELALERLPELAGQQRESFAKLRTDFFDYAVSTHKTGGENAQATEEDIRKTDAFFAREDFQRALLNRRFVEEEMLHTWVDEARCGYYLQRVIRFYEEHETAPCAQRVIDRAREMLKYQALASRLQKDREAKASEGAATLRNAPFFRHWINTGFYHAQNRATGQGLMAYLNRELPYLPEWSKEFLGVTEEHILPKAFSFRLDGDTVEVRFHLRYMEFLLNGEPVYRPCLAWERVAKEADMDAFFFALPITVATYGQYEAVKTEILRRLHDTAAPEDGRETIAGCLADQVCVLPPPGEVGIAPPEFDEDGEQLEERSVPPESVLPFEIFAENTECLYVCTWFQRDKVLVLFQQTPYGKQMVRGGEYYEVPDAASAIGLAQQLLQEQLFPSGLPMDELKTLPDAVYARPDFNVVCRDKDASPLWSTPVELLGEEVTIEKVEELLNRFFDNRIERLELSWKATIPVGEEQGYEPRRSLVFLKGSGGYACLYFDDFCAESYALLERPEAYGKDGRHNRVPFGKSKLFSHVIHHSPSTIRRQLDVIFSQVSWPNHVKFMAGGIWDYAENVSHGRAKYNLDKQLLADFPMERACNRGDAPFYFSISPHSAAVVDSQGDVEALEITDANRIRLQQMLGCFLKDGLPKLRMTWGKEEGERRHIVLLQDGGRFLMAWILEEKKSVRFHVADVWTYMDVEGKKYPKDTFQGRVTPAYLTHKGVAPLRNALELLLSDLETPGRITDKIAEYAEEKPVKARPYEALWAELVGDTIG